MALSSNRHHNNKKAPLSKVTGGLLVLACSLFILAGCLTTGNVESDLNNIKSDAYETKKDLAELKAMVTYANREIEALKSTSKGAAKEQALSGIRESQASLFSQVNDLFKEAQILQGRFDENKHYFDSALNSSSKSFEALNAKVVELNENIASLKGEFASLKDELATATAVAANAAAAAAATPAPEPLKQPLDEETAYKEAFQSYDEGNYLEAREKFNSFLKRFPKHKLAGNAQFWVGESYYSLKDFESAILTYEDVLKNYPDSHKVAAAMYKQALAFLELGDKTAGRTIFKEVLKKYPESDQATQVQIKLEALEQ